MTTEAIREGFRTLRLPGAIREYDRQRSDLSVGSLSFDERLALIIDRETSERGSRRRQRKVREATFRITAHPEQVDYITSRSVTKGELAHVFSLSWIQAHHNLLITGPTGIGKTFLATAIGTAACYQDVNVRYFRLSRLQERIGISRADGSYRSFAAKLNRIGLLIIDDFGLSPISATAAREFLDLLDDRIGVSSTVICSQLPPRSWHETMGDQSAADAIMDRIIHDSITLDLQGESMRKIRSNNLNRGGEQPD